MKTLIIYLIWGIGTSYFVLVMPRIQHEKEARPDSSIAVIDTVAADSLVVDSLKIRLVQMRMQTRKVLKILGELQQQVGRLEVAADSINNEKADSSGGKQGYKGSNPGTAKRMR